LKDSTITMIFALGFLVLITTVALYSILPLGTDKVRPHDVQCNRIDLESLEPFDYRLDVDIIPTEFVQALRAYKIKVFYDNRLIGEGELSWTENEVKLGDKPKRISLVVPTDLIGDTCEVDKIRFQANG